MRSLLARTLLAFVTAIVGGSCAGTRRATNVADRPVMMELASGSRSVGHGTSARLVTQCRENVHGALVVRVVSGPCECSREISAEGDEHIELCVDDVLRARPSAEIELRTDGRTSEIVRLGPGCASLVRVRGSRVSWDAGSMSARIGDLSLLAGSCALDVVWVSQTAPSELVAGGASDSVVAGVWLRQHSGEDQSSSTHSCVSIDENVDLCFGGGGLLNYGVVQELPGEAGRSGRVFAAMAQCSQERSWECGE